MSTEHFLAMAAFAFAMSATPGPNTLMLLASGVNYGFKATVPHMIGIMCGLGVMLAAVGAGLGAMLMSRPTLLVAMKAASIVYMVWLAWRIATSGPPREVGTGDDARPLTLLQAAVFQWVNPKAWAMALTGIAAYTLPDAYGPTLGAFIGVLMGLTMPVTAAWTALGVGMRGLLQRPAILRAFNVTMALLLLASLIPIVRDLMR